MPMDEGRSSRTNRKQNAGSQPSGRDEHGRRFAGHGSVGDGFLRDDSPAMVPPAEVRLSPSSNGFTLAQLEAMALL